MKFTDVMFDELSREQLQAMPAEWIAHYLGRPKRTKIVNAKRAMYFRSSLIGAFCVYTFINQGPYFYGILELVLIGYETAYYTQQRAKLEGDYVEDLRAYTEEAKSLPELASGMRMSTRNKKPAPMHYRSRP
ncbi:hypothetical protein [Stenotrophomonas sp.]|uniref:hypothetical protein n=1 Tax=Stenotrophomonas sp. TaxID=69392 RepID=UPI0028A95F31|nr:hypothetical protein [Stenotrophomonas sp.]